MLTFKSFLEPDLIQEQIDYDLHGSTSYVSAKHKELAAHNPKEQYTATERNAIGEHFKNDTGKINQHLIKTSKNSQSWYKEMPRKHFKTVEHINSAISKTKPLKSELSVYHGISKKDYTNHLEVGHTLHTPAYVSTSLSPHSATYFHGYHPGDHGHEKDHTILHFKLPSGYKKGMYIEHMSKIGEEEHEYVLRHDQKWKVHKVYKATDSDSHTHRVVELHPHEEK